MANRPAPRALNKTAEAVAANAAAEKARKAASKKALHADLAAKKAAAEAPAAEAPAAPAPAPATKTPEEIAAKRAAERAAYEKALHEDAAALGLTGDAAKAYVAESLDAVAIPKAGGYTGPMLVLRSAAKRYAKGKNGNPMCGDAMALTLDGLPREQVVATLILAMKLESNPYRHLNPGQQSMNLRNKARGAVKNGFLQYSEILAARAAVTTEREAA
jgi:pyruvate/2-oxoglutarate dehydrogenase complex dihydrolipoamide acyltransferase (E2) component